MVDEESGEEWITHVEYINENRFNAYIRDPDTGILTSLVLNAEVEMNPYDFDSVNVRTAHETFKVDYFRDEKNNISFLDYEGNPFPIVSVSFKYVW